jgi:hypothetical protein
MNTGRERSKKRGDEGNGPRVVVKVRVGADQARSLRAWSDQLGLSMAELLRSAWSDYLPTLRRGYDSECDEDGDEYDGLV